MDHEGLEVHHGVAAKGGEDVVAENGDIGSPGALGDLDVGEVVLQVKLLQGDEGAQLLRDESSRQGGR